MVNLDLIYTNEIQINNARALEFESYAKYYGAGNEVEREMSKLYESLVNNYKQISSFYSAQLSAQSNTNNKFNSLSDTYLSISNINSKLAQFFINALILDPINIGLNHLNNYHSQASISYKKASETLSKYK